MTYQIATFYMRSKYARKIAQGSRDMDNWHNWAGSHWPNHLKYHFDLKRSLEKRFKRAKKTAKYFLRKRNKTKAYWWLGMGLHSLQDKYSHPPGRMGVLKHGVESGIGMFGKSPLGWFSPAAKWYGRYGSIYDEPRNNRRNYVRALQRTDVEIAKFQRYL